jgi:hypothetical protein
MAMEVSMAQIDETFSKIDNLIDKLENDDKEVDSLIAEQLKKQFAGDKRDSIELNAIQLQLSNKYHSQIRDKIHDLEETRDNLLKIKREYGDLVAAI